MEDFLNNLISAFVLGMVIACLMNTQTTQDVIKPALVVRLHKDCINITSDALPLVITKNGCFQIVEDLAYIGLAGQFIQITNGSRVVLIGNGNSLYQLYDVSGIVIDKQASVVLEHIHFVTYSDIQPYTAISTMHFDSTFGIVANDAYSISAHDISFKSLPMEERRNNLFRIR